MPHVHVASRLRAPRLQDGRAEVLLGTFNCRLLIYRDTGDSPAGPGYRPSYQLVYERRFSYPVYGIQVGDFNDVG